MRRLVGSLAFACLAFGSPAEAVELAGKYGYIGEWEFRASVAAAKSEASPGASLLGGFFPSRQHVGAFTLRHTAMCMPGETPEKNGTIVISKVARGAAVAVRLDLDGQECRYNGTLAQDQVGFVDCPGKPRVPLTLWLK